SNRALRCRVKPSILHSSPPRSIRRRSATPQLGSSSDQLPPERAKHRRAQPDPRLAPESLPELCRAIPDAAGLLVFGIDESGRSLQVCASSFVPRWRRSEHDSAIAHSSDRSTACMPRLRVPWFEECGRGALRSCSDEPVGAVLYRLRESISPAPFDLLRSKP